MKFTLALAMTPPERIVPLAKIADEAGWDAVAVPDSVFFPEQVSAKYPYTPDGERFWPADTPFVDPLVAIPAMAAATERLSFVTNVLKTPLREPLLVAKAVGSMASMFPGRIALGVGLSWIPEEFRWLGQEKKTRGKRLDEQIDVIRACLAGGWVEHHGDHYDFDRLRMEPAPGPGVPIHVGGHSDAGIARAARVGDGWIGAQADRDELASLVQRIWVALDAEGRADAPFEIQATPLVPATVEAMRDLAEIGLTGIITVPWYFMGGGDPNDLAHQEASIRWFAETVIAPFRQESAA
ncbi:TIGR03619 family F420-dependent LLM class oxidoreductase [Aquihabitans sp. G128]|uniref:TIGR03619 family F420-dependent LLM class oxidoreductase n=1 Tax=Aquihabitans sp. G128 TaxID=2849779 RepID=UPI001C2245F1|nr:TIGR03619 family F420-dependent LLM class oxidoreductase [Aquihabitans sp. G128]QXC62683.1 TIGR03619 family F420-dependent LLM class oxidoreductase [Aquihabitans sp. G128]